MTQKSNARWLLLGVTAVLLFGWLALTPAGLLGKADALAYAVCHRIESHSLFLGDRPLPLCARCTGMYLGAMLGLFFQARQGKKGAFPRWPVWALVALLGAAFAIDGVNSFLQLLPGGAGLYPPSNTLRLLTGTGAGLSIAVMLYPVFCQVLFADWQPTAALNSTQQVVTLVLAALLMDVLLLSGNPLLVYPLAVISALGVPLVLGLLYTAIWLVIFRRESQFNRLSAAWLPLVGGLATVLLHVVLIDAARFWWTGTWGGLPLG